MLERIREGSQGPWAMIIIALIVLSFVFAGVGSYVSSSGANAAATVNGEEISLVDLERAYQSQRARMEAQYGETVSTLFSDESYLADFRRNVLDQLIAEKLIEQKAFEMGLRISDKQIKDAIVSMPEFQLGGVFDNERYLLLLRQNGIQPSGFRDMLRLQMTREQLTRSLSGSDFALPSEVARVNDLQLQTRDAKYITVASEPFKASVTVSDTDVDAFYQANITRYDTEEEVKIAYIELNAETLRDGVTVTEQDVADFYETNKAIYRSEEQRRLSHILVEFGEDESAARERAEALLSRVQSGEAFDVVAEAESADLLSAENGGDLDFVARGDMDAAFEDAAFELVSVGDVTEVVQTEFGFHIIKLTELVPEQVKPLSEVEEEIKAQLVADAASEKFYELQTTMEQMAFEIPDTLEDVAAELNTEIVETESVTRNTVPAAINHPQVVTAVFSPELIEEGVNSDVIELGNEHVVVARVVGHTPQRTKSLDEVKDSIVSELQAEKAQQAAESWALGVVDKLNNGEDVAADLAEYTLAWETTDAVTRNDTRIARNLVTELFKLAPTEGENRQVATLFSGDVGIVELVSVNSAPAADDAISQQITQQLAQAVSAQTYQYLIDELRANASISVNI